MREDIKARWIEELESGEYPKGKYRLRSEEGTFCCLGVLADMYAKEHRVGWTYIKNGLFPEGTNYDADSLLPPEVRAWAGIADEEEKEIHSAAGKGSLYFINDHNDTFEPVIERIREICQ